MRYCKSILKRGFWRAGDQGFGRNELARLSGVEARLVLFNIWIQTARSHTVWTEPAPPILRFGMRCSNQQPTTINWSKVDLPNLFAHHALRSRHFVDLFAVNKELNPNSIEFVFTLWITAPLPDVAILQLGLNHLKCFSCDSSF